MADIELTRLVEQNQNIGLFQDLTIKNIVNKVLAYRPNANVELIKKSYKYCLQYHDGQTRESGEPYCIHPIAVAQMIVDMKLDEKTVATALLHDVIEDTTLTIEEIAKEFSPQIADLIDGVTKLRKIEFKTTEAYQSENFRKLFLALSKDIRVVIVKFCDRLHNVQTIEFQLPKKQNKIALETLEVYAPLAERLGMQEICDQLQDASFKVLNPIARSSITNRLQELKQQYNKEVGTNNIIIEIQNMLTNLLKEGGIKNISVTGREKSKYSIWQKLINKKISFNELCDAIAFRITTCSVKDCYKALGIVHQAYHAVPETFTDYVSTPKENEYRSIHTAIFGPFNSKIEIQIRTKEMDVQATYGLASHWQYKQGSLANINNIAKYKRTSIWINKVLQMMQNTNDAEEFLEAAKLEMYQQQIFAFTNTGEMVILPSGATMLDFAFVVNTQTGLKCFGAEINGELYRIEDEVKNGSKIRIITNESVKPQLSWLTKCVTGRAKTIIRHKTRETPEKINRDKGRTTVYKLFHQYNIIQNEVNLKTLISHINGLHISDLYIKASEDKKTVSEIIAAKINSFKLIEVKKQTQIKNTNYQQDYQNRLQAKKQLSKNQQDFGNIVTVSLSNGVKMLGIYAKCCNPSLSNKGKLLGITMQGYPIFLHLEECKNIKNIILPDNSKIDILWKQISKNCD
ncbi:MAG: bifunctional (p)ppGpp synthetase/guanosine-3',5'-bis(diphosphate) 3'-pyrophosphohydrolase [Alphaproteobacteria bacterium]|nr:bifunctional (p)ppGpp synthetase/guanosine-3',5'-bis(diphosphate) 3'-pyrophosphohydrolase [Rickettsiales bacterium]